MNRQARVSQSNQWNDYGNVGLIKAAEAEAIAAAKFCMSVEEVDWVVFVRDADDPEIPEQSMTVTTRLSTTVKNSRSIENDD
ncbi:hypothetical protein VN12_04165 [Pirellula sp. SH-Sr6A]|uniref:hypothetical protein n=1 Tax=Pirellula sp. SH-Sr6A TaxID=1632865 RepID=UPI00078D9DE9|nr:hypothetical protein [Pirellula sp. SH-Sr6A]AMV31287.1 hypothetical protein VN12_04165 [Pirellula sp. SH-Sr6A]